jgi:hypothetical protein
MCSKLPDASVSACTKECERSNSREVTVSVVPFDSRRRSVSRVREVSQVGDYAQCAGGGFPGTGITGVSGTL